MIVVDGRTDEEKLHELLAGGAEETTLNFKATLDLAQRSSKAVLDFVKDAISMGNLPEGGYIVVGVNDDGVPAHDQATLDVAQFDSSKLRDKVGEYVEGKVRLVSQSHEVGGRTVVLVHVQPTPDGLPVPTSCIGQYDKGQGQMETVFSEGEVLIREGISNTRLRHAHWHSLLARYREQIRADARADADALIHRVVEAFKSDGGAQSVPLDLSMSDEALADAIVVAFEGPSPVRVRQFLNTAKQTAITAADDRAEWLHALDRVTIVACQAVMYQRKDVYQFVVEALEAIYQAQELPPDEPRLTSSDADTARRLLDVLLRVMAIGSLVVRQKAWIYLPALVLRPVQVTLRYTYASWLRHGTVLAARAGLLQGSDGKNRGGELISLARALVAQTPATRPDHAADAPASKAEDLHPGDWLLNSLCQFDLWWCILAAVCEPGDQHGGVFYPSCAALHQYRSQPTLERIARDPDARRAAFGDAPSDAEIAQAMVEVVQVAVGQSHQCGGWWDGISDSALVDSFVTRQVSAACQSTP